MGVVSSWGDLVVALCSNYGHMIAVNYGIGLRKNVQDTLPRGYLVPVLDYRSSVLLSHLQRTIFQLNFE